MYHYVTDKTFIRQSYSICADLVNQLVQRLKQDGIRTRMATVGSKGRGLITQNGKKPIDYDFNLIVHNADQYGPRNLKRGIMQAFNDVLRRNGWGDCKDSTSVITTEKMVLKGSRTPFSIDLCIVRIDPYGGCRRLIHHKTGFEVWDQYTWQQAPRSEKLAEKERDLKPDHWNEVRETYLNKKNMYLRRNDDMHPSFICYIEALNEVYYKYYPVFSMSAFFDTIAER